MSDIKVIAFMKQRYLAAGFSLLLLIGSIADVQVRFQTQDPKKGEEVGKTLQAMSESPAEIQSVSYVGPQIGEELTNDGGLGLLFSLAVVMAYVAMRFQFKFSVGAVAALIHDVVIVLGVFSIFQLDFDLTVLAAVLAVIGYSLNDTIVVADRIRENFRIVRTGDSTDIINISLTQTLERTLITSLTTLLVLLALYFVGGEMIHNFALALIVGVVIGTYSSIYVAANVLLTMNITRGCSRFSDSPKFASASDSKKLSAASSKARNRARKAATPGMRSNTDCFAMVMLSDQLIDKV